MPPSREPALPPPPPPEGGEQTLRRAADGSVSGGERREGDRHFAATDPWFDSDLARSLIDLDTLTLERVLIANTRIGAGDLGRSAFEVPAPAAVTTGLMGFAAVYLRRCRRAA